MPSVTTAVYVIILGLVVVMALFFAPAPSFNTREIETFRNLPLAEKTTLIEQKAKRNPEQAWEFLKRASTNKDGQTLFDAHELSHIVGNALYDQRGFFGIDACDETFGYGCYHGVIEETFHEYGPQALTEMELLCDELFVDDSQKYVACIHGIGHGLLTYNTYNLDESLADCARLELSYDCVSGVFMEYAFGAPLTKEFFENPWGVCTDSSDPIVRATCGAAVSMIMIIHFDTFNTHALSKEESLTANIHACESAPDTYLRDGCVWMIAGVLAHNAPQSPETITSGCRQFASTETQNMCLLEAAKKLAYRDYSNWEKNIGALCSESHKDVDGCVESVRESRGIHTTLRTMTLR